MITTLKKNKINTQNHNDKPENHTSILTNPQDDITCLPCDTQTVTYPTIDQEHGGEIFHICDTGEGPAAN